MKYETWDLFRHAIHLLSGEGHPSVIHGHYTRKDILRGGYIAAHPRVNKNVYRDVLRARNPHDLGAGLFGELGDKLHDGGQQLLEGTENGIRAMYSLGHSYYRKSHATYEKMKKYVQSQANSGKKQLGSHLLKLQWHLD